MIVFNNTVTSISSNINRCFPTFREKHETFFKINLLERGILKEKREIKKDKTMPNAAFVDVQMG